MQSRQNLPAKRQNARLIQVMNHQLRSDLVPHLESHHTHAPCLVLALASILHPINAKKLVLAQGDPDHGPDHDHIHAPGQNRGEDLRRNQLKSDHAQGLAHALMRGGDSLPFAQVSAVLVAHPPGHVTKHMEDRDLVPGLVAGIG